MNVIGRRVEVAIRETAAETAAVTTARGEESSISIALSLDYHLAQNTALTFKSRHFYLIAETNHFHTVPLKKGSAI